MKKRNLKTSQLSLIYIAVIIGLAIAIGSIFVMTNRNVVDMSRRNGGVVEIVKKEDKPLSIKSMIVEYRLNQLQNRLNASMNEIVCWGDSLTYGSLCDTNYPSILAQLIQDRLLNQTDLHNFFDDSYDEIINNYSFRFKSMNVVNLGVGGETSKMIVGRNGAIDMVIEEAFTIPADTVPVPIIIGSISGGLLQPIRAGDGGVNPVVIEGVEGIITVDQEDAFSENYQYYFTRNKPGKETEVNVASVIHTYCENAYLNDTMIIFMGTNGGYASIEDLVEQHRAMLNQQINKEYIILGMHYGDCFYLNEVDIAMEEAFGDNYISLHKAFFQINYTDYGYELSSEDSEITSLGRCPNLVLLEDGLHFNEKGYTIIADLIYKRMDSLGYFDSIKEILKLS